MERSFAIALVISMLSVVFGLMAGYALATLPFKGRRLYFILVIGVLLVPFPSIMVAVFIMTQKLGLVDTYLGVIVPGALSPLGVFLMRQYLLRLPKEMVEAARIDGANEFRIFVQLIVPLSWPVISAVAVLTFVASWNNLLWPLIVLSQPAHYTMPLALTEFNSVNATDYVGIVAMSVVAIAPIVILFLLSRRRLLDSIMLSGGGVVG